MLRFMALGWILADGFALAVGITGPDVAFRSAFTAVAFVLAARAYYGKW